MKTRYLFLVPLSCMLLAACTTVDNPSNSEVISVASESEQSIVSTPSEESKESSSVIDIDKVLDMPVLTVNESLFALTWSAITDATGYSVKVDGADAVTITNPIYEMPSTEGTHRIVVQAVDALLKYAPSNPAEFAYEVSYTELGEITYANNEISWASLKGLGVEYKVNDGEYVKVEGNSIRVSGSGSYSLRAISGVQKNSGRYDVYYLNDESKVNTRTLIVSAQATTDLVLEAGTDRTDSGLQEKYDVQKYGNNGWQASSASISLDGSNDGFTDGKCVKLGFWRHGEWFKFTKAVDITGTYDTLRFFAKGVENSQLILSFEITQTKQFGDIAIKGVYITYQFDEVASEWTEYSISMADQKWKIDFGDGNKLSPDKFVAALATKGINISSLADVLPYFDVFQIRCKASADSIGSNVYYYLDEVKLTNDGLQTATKQIVKIKETYACKGDNASGTFKTATENTGSITINGNNPLAIDVKYELTSESKLRIQSNTNGIEFDALFSSKHNGNEFELESVTGAQAAYFAGMKMASYAVVEDYESFTDTGVGYDYNNKDASTRTGLRGAYYADYYTGSTVVGDNESPLGGNGWSLIKSTDYLNVNTDLDNVHSGAKSARFKYNRDCDMRYFTYGLYDKTATMLPSGSVFSFWTKGVPGRKSVLLVKVWSTQQVTASNQQTASLYATETFEIASDSGWVECKVTLKPGTAYYGFSIHPRKQGDTYSNPYVYIDDITIYNSISPWGE